MTNPPRQDITACWPRSLDTSDVLADQVKFCKVDRGLCRCSCAGWAAKNQSSLGSPSRLQSSLSAVLSTGFVLKDLTNPLERRLGNGIGWGEGGNDGRKRICRSLIAVLEAELNRKGDMTLTTGGLMSRIRKPLDPEASKGSDLPTVPPQLPAPPPVRN